MHRLERVVVGTLIFSLVLAFLISARIARVLSAPIKTLAQTAAGIEQDDFVLDDLGSITGRRDELGQFARVFKRMAEEVHARQQKLQERIKSLTIKIDLIEQSKQVDKITDSEFFKKLQDQTRQMRDEEDE